MIALQRSPIFLVFFLKAVFHQELVGPESDKFLGAKDGASDNHKT
jgi:hypothetical protein